MKEKFKGVAVAMAAVAALAICGAAIAGASGNGSDSSSQATASEPSKPAESQNANEGREAGEGQEANEGPDQAIGGSALDQASAAALQETGGGQVTETEVGDEESYYEVEVTRDDGSQVDVQLDRAFNVVGSEADNE